MEFPLVAGIGVASNADSTVRLTFEDQGGALHAHYLDQATALWLLSELAKKLETGSLAPISRDDLRPGVAMRVVGVLPSPHPDGAQVVLLAEVDGRQVTVPFVLSFDQIEDISAASRRPANDG
ncbi:hypothetical protein [Mesorhizobium sp. A556]